MSADQLCVIAGHSHIAAFGIPQSTPGSPFALRELDHPSGRFRIVSGEWPRTDSYWEAARKAAAGHIVALFWRGNQHVSHYLLELDEPFDFVLANEPALPVDETATLLPEGLVREIFSSSLSDLKTEIELMRNAGAVPVVCATPPPRGDDEMLRRDFIQKQADWVGRRNTRRRWLGDAETLTDPSAVRLTPRLIRYKLWVVLQTMVREVAEAVGSPFVESPRSAQTEEGFLRDEYKLDITHANKAYGAIVMDELWRRFMQPGSKLDA